MNPPARLSIKSVSLSLDSDVAIHVSGERERRPEGTDRKRARRAEAVTPLSFPSAAAESSRAPLEKTKSRLQEGKWKRWRVHKRFILTKLDYPKKSNSIYSSSITISSYWKVHISLHRQRSSGAVLSLRTVEDSKTPGSKKSDSWPEVRWVQLVLSVIFAGFPCLHLIPPFSFSYFSYCSFFSCCSSTFSPFFGLMFFLLLVVLHFLVFHQNYYNIHLSCTDFAFGGKTQYESFLHTFILFRKLDSSSLKSWNNCLFLKRYSSGFKCAEGTI